MSKQMVLEYFCLSEHFSANVTKESGAVATRVRRTRQQMPVQGDRMGKALLKKKITDNLIVKVLLTVNELPERFNVIFSNLAQTFTRKTFDIFFKLFLPDGKNHKSKPSDRPVS